MNSVSNKHTDTEFVLMKDLIRTRLEELCIYYEIESRSRTQAKAKYLISKYEDSMRSFLDQPHGGTFSPEELAEMILVQEYKRQDNAEEASTLVHY